MTGRINNTPEAQQQARGPPIGRGFRAASHMAQASAAALICSSVSRIPASSVSVKAS